MGKPFSTKMLILLPQKSRCSVTTSKQSVVLGRLLAADTLLSRLEGLQRSEWDTETLGSHGRSTRLQVLVPKKDQANSPSVVEIKHSEHNKQTVGEITGNIMYTIPICQTYLAVIFLIQSSHSIPPQNGIWTIYQAKENI